MNKAEIKITNNIKKYGCHVMSVFDCKGKDRRFTSAIGIYQNIRSLHSWDTQTC
ncbi:DUF4262 domain-containing protein [Pseudoalteromonas sp. KG3]|uniref:Transposase n=1 Tax=Pseudoalteromonas prydzensis TaxID=182141 RepID=A0ABR9FHF9_9GAMM|nr:MULTISPECIES: hypothetical protein [Pseudoalteromonas]MBE0456258.1 hypothetical protein [Pseudoalteromonas prydzensis]WKD24169.1 DUF4262 domain-containing protein [Pseudoalteromonas sp. KG3]